MKRPSRSLSVLSLAAASLFVAVGLAVTACESENKDTRDNVLDVTPSYTKMNQGHTVTLTASGGKDYVWSLSDDSIGSLSSRHGASVVYKAQICTATEATQTVTVQGNLPYREEGSNSVSQATGTATILHLAKPTATP